MAEQFLDYNRINRLLTKLEGKSKLSLDDYVYLDHEYIRLATTKTIASIPLLHKCGRLFIRACFENKKYHEGHNTLKALEFQFPNDPVLVFDRFKLIMDCGDPMAARQFLEKKEKQLDSLDIKKKLIFNYLNMQPYKTEEAIKKINEILIDNPDDIEMKANLAYVLISERQYEEGLNILHELEKNNADYDYLSKLAPIYKQASEILIHQTQIEEGLEFMNKASDLLQEPGFYTSIALSYIDMARKFEDVDKDFYDFCLRCAGEYIFQLHENDVNDISFRIAKASYLSMINGIGSGIEELTDTMRDFSNDKDSFNLAYILKNHFINEMKDKTL